MQQLVLLDLVRLYVVIAQYEQLIFKIAMLRKNMSSFSKLVLMACFGSRYKASNE